MTIRDTAISRRSLWGLGPGGCGLRPRRPQERRRGPCRRGRHRRGALRLHVVPHVQPGGLLRPQGHRRRRQARARGGQRVPLQEQAVPQGPHEPPERLRPRPPALPGQAHQPQEGHRRRPRLGAHLVGRGPGHHRREVQRGQGEVRPPGRDPQLGRPQGAPAHHLPPGRRVRHAQRLVGRRPVRLRARALGHPVLRRDRGCAALGRNRRAPAVGLQHRLVHVPAAHGLQGHARRQEGRLQVHRGRHPRDPHRRAAGRHLPAAAPRHRRRPGPGHGQRHHRGGPL